MAVANSTSGTNVHEVSDGICRIDTSVALPDGGGFSYFRRQLDYFSRTKNVRTMIEKLAAAQPRVLACMHGSAWRGDGGRLLRALRESLAA